MRGGQKHVFIIVQHASSRERRRKSTEGGGRKRRKLEGEKKNGQTQMNDIHPPHPSIQSFLA